MTWKTYPDNVTKIFYNKYSKEKAIANAARINELMGANEGHRVYNYIHTFKAGNIPGYQEFIPRARPTSNVFPLRMPKLGMDISKLGRLNVESLRLREDLKSVPILSILTQFEKLFTQLDHLIDNNSIHGDIRQTNVMIKKDGTITIIDFDFLNSLDEFMDEYKFAFGFYSNPPESLIYNISVTYTPEKIATLTPDALLTDVPATVKYTNDQIQTYKFWNKLGMHFYNLQYAALEANIDNLKYLESLNNPATPDFEKKFKLYAMPSFDSFGLACTLLELVDILYGCVGSYNVDEIVHILITRNFKNGAVDYTDAERYAAAKAIFRMTFEVLIPMIRFKVRDRMLVFDFGGRPGARTLSKLIVEELRAAAGAGVGNKSRRMRRKSRATRKNIPT